MLKNNQLYLSDYKVGKEKEKEKEKEITEENIPPSILYQHKGGIFSLVLG